MRINLLLLSICAIPAWAGTIAITHIGASINATSVNGTSSVQLPAMDYGAYSSFTSVEFCIQGSCVTPEPILPGTVLRLTNIYLECSDRESACPVLDINFSATGTITGPVNFSLGVDNLEWDVGLPTTGNFHAALQIVGGGLYQTSLAFDSSGTEFGPTPAIMIPESGAFSLTGAWHLDGLESVGFIVMSDSATVQFTSATLPEVSVPEPGSAGLMLLGVAGLAARLLRAVSRA